VSFLLHPLRRSLIGNSPLHDTKCAFTFSFPAAPRSTLHASRCMLPAPRCTPRAACSPHHAARLALHARLNTPHASRRPASCASIASRSPRGALRASRSLEAQLSKSRITPSEESARRSGSKRRRESLDLPTDARPSRKQSRQFFRSEQADAKQLSACPVCLGRFPHRVKDCTRRTLWDVQRTDRRRLQVVASRLVLCTDWQTAGGCRESGHDSKHECSGCGSLGHGAQGCPSAQKDGSPPSV